jgi:hypothetical protein
MHLQILQEIDGLILGVCAKVKVKISIDELTSPPATIWRQQFFFNV